jgi:excisionase family DNA binding protein
MSSNIKIIRICNYCSKDFISRTTVTKYCGDVCAKRAYKERKRLDKINSSNLETAENRKQKHHALTIKTDLTVKEVALIANCSPCTIYRLIKNGRIKATNKFKRKTFIKRGDFQIIVQK